LACGSAVYLGTPLSRSVSRKGIDPHIIRHAIEVGTESAKKALANAFATFSQTRFVVEDLIAEGDKVALRVTVHGVPTPPGEPPLSSWRFFGSKTDAWPKYGALEPCASPMYNAFHT